MPRIAETPCGMLNSIGLANVGVERFLSEKLPALSSLDTIVIVNIAGSSIEEYVEVVKRIHKNPRVDALEVNVSCPNVKKGGLAFGTDPDITYEVVKRICEVTDKPVVTKLTPNVTDIVQVAKAAESGGTAAISLINTVLGMGVDIESRRPLLARIVGGLSGPAIKPIALAKVYHVVRSTRIPVIGIGGIMNWQDAMEFFIVGASAVQVGTANFVQPDCALQIIEGLKTYCEKRGIEYIRDVIGTLKME
jgi:dihydroorotate dehydrogenase (NAD+) catalytic subunit